MATSYKILIEGYATQIEGGWLASSSTTLIKNEGVNIIVDPGVNRQKLLAALAAESLSTSDIDFVFMTHCHPDHNLLTGIFERAQVLDNELLYENDKQTEHSGTVPGTKIQILRTPGHDQFHGSLLVPTEQGIVAVAGDVFWWTHTEEQKIDYESLLNHEDPFVKDSKALLESRKKLLEAADYIIPGHGKMFKVLGG